MLWWQQSSGPGFCILLKKKEIQTRGLSCRTRSRTREILTRILLCAVGFMLQGIQSLLVFEVCSWHLSQHAYHLKKKIPMMLKILHRLACLQSVGMLYSYFYTSCRYLDMFKSKKMFTIILFFFIKVDCRWIRLKEGCLGKGFVLHFATSG